MIHHADPQGLNAAFFFAGLDESMQPAYEPAEYRCVELNGVFISTKRGIVGHQRASVADLTLVEAKESLGEWVGIFRHQHDENRFVVTADPFGYQPVYYSVNREATGASVFISSAPAGLTHLLRKYTGHTSVNWVETIACLSTERAWARTMQSVRTFGENVFVLNPGEYLHISPESVGLTREDMFDPDGESYDELLDRGIEKAVAQLELATKLPTSQHVINLSGGKDSRMMMAMLSAAGLSDKYRVSTVNPRTWGNEKARPGLMKDLQIADVIRARYGMKWSLPILGSAERISFDESLEIWQAYRSNQNFDFRGGQTLFTTTDPKIELRGAAGETFRGFTAVKQLEQICNFTNSPDAFEEDVANLVNHLYKLDSLPAPVAEAVPGMLQDLLRYLGGASISDSLHRRFSVYRNRSHFGHIRHSLSRRNLPVFPLSQVEFTKARAHLSEEDKQDSKIAFDIIERLNPELNDLAFDNGAWPETFFERAGRSRSNGVWEGPTAENYLTDYFENQKLASSERAAYRKIHPTWGGSEPVSDAVTEARTRVVEHLDHLASVPGAEEYFTDPFKKRLLTGVNNGRVNPRMLLAKLASAHDHLDGAPMAHSSVFCLDPSQEGIIEVGYFTSQPRKVRPVTKVDSGLPSLETKLAWENGRLQAVAMPKGEVKGSYEYAFYLYKGTKRIDVSWYSEMPYADFGDGHDPGQYRVTAFIRDAYRPKLKKTQDSGMVQVE